ncbi:hypothetical protein A2866_02180 [Candidatus Roizmanbacteria bacterium RIFCSPHIGHO2_01_FULL_39_8]|uniref:DegT/DnrJ/EryC1/StrS aminotransferase n=2 Tax=Candidatus Roizmaniibacteriota TaxID=1752723 RepID=A0A1F7GFV9_9BACT|nr:MAG: hypothetical protein A2866_02180 [Candidatus Roizmanbacteria bacterium RIFCSPHIGHO2_01_FULL_39_8]OGK25807.1 MAG: hypothetical protein A3C28_00795 [Candidatus Roizmanbacteria bacterium RIFCSPHIGHO2_02_FULL_39_9]
MISTDFAPNETWSDAWVSIKLLFQPWRWKKGKEMSSIQKDLLSQFQITNNKLQITLFLSGRSALYNLLQSLKLPNNSEVLIQAFTCEAVVLPIIEANLKPIYVDIETQTFSMDSSQLVNKVTGNSKVLILQHTFGLTPKYRKEILIFAKEHNLIVIEDLAHGFNPQLFSPPNSYLLTPNSYSLLSFGRSKALSSVFGAALISSNRQLANKLTSHLAYPSYLFIFKCLLYKPLVMLIKSTYDIKIGLILHKLFKSINLLVLEISESEKGGKFDQLLNKRLPNGLTVLLENQLKKFAIVQQNRSKITNLYHRHFQKTINYKLQTMNSPLLRYPLLVENRNLILQKARRQNIFLGKWYDQVVAPKDLDLERVEYKLGSCPVAEGIGKKIINLPTNITLKKAEEIVNILNDVK